MKPIFIIGAPRSGTNILRDTLTSNKNFVTWDCDEINYIWRYKSIFKKSDELKVKDITLKKRKYIRSQFEKIISNAKPNSKNEIFLIEKTCANCLRIEFVYSLFPEAKFIYIKRNPFDTISSIKQRWVGSISSKYLLKKAKYIPKSELVYYLLKYVFYRLKKSISKSNAFPSWGPRFEGIDYYKEKNNLIQTCAKQWLECTEKAERDLSKINKKGIVSYISYEDLVKIPVKVISQIFEELHINISTTEFDITKINTNSINKSKDILSKEEIKLINSVLIK